MITEVPYLYIDFSHQWPPNLLKILDIEKEKMK
jgi:hypothetical protein